MPQSNQNYTQNSKTLLFLLSFIQMFISSAAFFLFQAKSMQEYFKTLSVIITIFVCVIYISICKWKMVDILQLIEKFEEFIRKSKRMMSAYHSELSSFRFNLWIQFYCNRIAYAFKEHAHVYPIEWQNRTNLWICLLCLGPINSARNFSTLPNQSCDQFFSAESKRRVILLAIFCDVIPALFKLPWKKNFFWSFQFLGCHLIGKRCLVIWLFYLFNVCTQMLYVWVFIQRFAFSLARACSSNHLSMILQMIWLFSMRLKIIW